MKSESSGAERGQTVSDQYPAPTDSVLRAVSHPGKLFPADGAKYTAAQHACLETGSAGTTYTPQNVSYNIGDNAECLLSIKVTTAGKATATLTYDTGKKKKGKKVYYKPSCSTVVRQASAADPNSFVGEVYFYFGASADNNFPEFSGHLTLDD